MYYYFKQTAFKYEVIEHQKVENINMVKSSKIESNKIKELVLTMKELKVIARLRGVKSYENISRIRLEEEIDRLEPSKKLKNKKNVSSLLLKGKKILDLSQEKVKRKMNKKEVLKLSLKKNKNIQETVDKLILKVKQLKKILVNLKKMFTNQ